MLKKEVIYVGIFSKSAHEKTLKVLSKIAKKNEFLVLSDVSFSVGEKEFLADYILLTKAGALVLKRYDLSGKLYYNDEKGDWAHIDKNNDKTYIENPIVVAEKTADAIRRIFAKENIYKTEVEAYSIFTQNSDRALSIYAPERLPYLRLSKLGKLLKSPKYLKDKGILPKVMSEAILKYKV